MRFVLIHSIIESKHESEKEGERASLKQKMQVR